MNYQPEIQKIFVNNEIKQRQLKLERDYYVQKSNEYSLFIQYMADENTKVKDQFNTYDANTFLLIKEKDKEIHFYKSKSTYFEKSNKEMQEKIKILKMNNDVLERKYKYLIFKYNFNNLD
jgi:hypothetical protein